MFRLMRDECAVQSASERRRSLEAALSERVRRGRSPDPGRCPRGGRGLLPSPRPRGRGQPTQDTSAARGRPIRCDGLRRQRARLCGPQVVRLDRDRDALRRPALLPRSRRARRRDRGGHPRTAPHGRRLRCRCAASGPDRGIEPRRDRLRLASCLADRLDPCSRARDRAGRRPLQERGAARRVLPDERLPACRIPSRGGRSRHRRHRHDGSKDPVLRGEWLREGALVCASIGAHHEPGSAKARQRGARARSLRLLRLQGAVGARVGRPDRARRARRPRLARGPRAPGRRLG